MTLSMEWYVFNKEESSKPKRPLVQYLELSPSYAGYKFEPVNMNCPNKNDKIKKQMNYHVLLPLFLSL